MNVNERTYPMSQTRIIFSIILITLVARKIGADQTIDDVRIPNDTEPLLYNLRLIADHNDSDIFIFRGQVEILIKVNKITPIITLNAKDMNIDYVSVTDLQNQKRKLMVLNYKMIDNKEWLKIYLSKNLVACRQYMVFINFHGDLRTDMTGFYKSMYSVNNVTMWMAASNFKPTYARRAFPCYDEPRYKTPFNISLGRDINQITLSNTRIITTQDIVDSYGKWKLDYYNTTQPISTYMVGAFVGNLSKSTVPTGRANITLYTYDDYLTQARYAMEETPILYDTIENYTGVKGEVDKMEFLALPDFEGDGAETWGLNSYRERYVLFDDESKTKFKEQSTMVIEQQQSHQWFGNLVTCSWWDELWLNEGFARYFQYFGTDMVKWDWRLKYIFVVEQHQAAMEFDQTPRHPVTVPVTNSSDIPNTFNRITYNKAASILRMIKYTINETNFQKPLKSYLKKFKFGVASSDDLWSEFEEHFFETGFALKDSVMFTQFVKSWTDQLGYPVINVKYDGYYYTISQDRFSIWPMNITQGLWYIGLTYTTNLKKNFTDLSPVKWMTPPYYLYRKETYIRDPIRRTRFMWHIFNIQSIGLYRVNYEERNWGNLTKQLLDSHVDIHVLNRAQLIDDSFNLARAGMLNYSIALNLSKYLINENDTIPWMTAIECTSYVIERMRRSNEGYSFIKSFVRNLAETIYNKTETLILRYNTSDHTTLTSWNKFSVWACYLDSDYCMKSALDSYTKWSWGEKISPDFKDAAFCNGIKLNKDEDTWNKMMVTYTTTKSASEKNSAQSALACSQNRTILFKYLDYLSNSTDSPVRLQDFKDICDAMSLTPQGIETLSDFLVLNLHRMINTIPTGDSIVMHIYSVLASKVALDSEIVKLFNLKNTTNLSSKIKASFEKSYVHVEQNLLWYKHYHVAINKWLGAPMDPTTIAPKTTIHSSKITTVSRTTSAPKTTAPPITTAPPKTTAPPNTTAPPKTTVPPEITDQPTTGSESDKKSIGPDSDTKSGAQSQQLNKFMLVKIFIFVIVLSKFSLV